MSASMYTISAIVKFSHIFQFRGLCLSNNVCGSAEELENQRQKRSRLYQCKENMLNVHTHSHTNSKKVCIFINTFTSESTGYAPLVLF